MYYIKCNLIGCLPGCRGRDSGVPRAGHVNQGGVTIESEIPEIPLRTVRLRFLDEVYSVKDYGEYTLARCPPPKCVWVCCVLCHYLFFLKDLGIFVFIFLDVTMPTISSARFLLALSLAVECLTEPLRKSLMSSFN